MSAKFDGSRGPPQIEGMVSLKVDNLTYRTSMEDLERYFKKYGELGDIYIPRDRNTHESRGFAFVRYYEERDAEDAMDSMDGKVIDGREIRVAMARYGRPSNQYDPGRRSRGGDRGYDRRSSGYNRRRSPPKRRRSRSRSKSYERRRSRSRSHNRRKSVSKSPRKRSESPQRRRSHSRSPVPRQSNSRSRSGSRDV
ncbi:serine/arginine-rich splicing factor 2 isoform X1 [Hydra vulgaris]|uniref:Serine/arginine-rich splicing factor 2 n=1 Tax=Hydra vulgaris TaxID=6087 RepID=T2MDQ6_HYDVU|nr:serine/arginine-rich splicing factor 2 isoform X1 [Hydra vulgaris]